MAEQSANFAAAFFSGVATAFTLGLENVDLVNENEANNIYFNSFPPQFNTEAYPIACLYRDLDQLPTSMADQAPYVFVMDPI